ncbi:conjugal transfer protein TraG N-terminal domain-containing protein (plasmid) [Providencia huaxiensis]|uniref:TraG N-terminal Proteobacteria domain-containing protein n=7 Tax=Enterobacterales TaxID=91347 RepID=A0A7L8KA43_ECOLX|nr:MULTISPECIES: conjugal transfer protein TraG N-terminal domain-containing protein [Enterobacterales]ELB1214826.1 conjugal transfer protein TraG N-terminal domain-containing protein [Proteus mirabilis]ELY4881469.1 conjugal transfer protein TraG N-terminal domain-containing protein [Morganella morganii]SPY66630.1 conjugal transfer mating pair stabilization protein TraG [Providencia stuartii]ELR5094268.1 conjugal transfer protein TraG N-terminal domain-containing protein [Providencia rettgeri]
MSEWNIYTVGSVDFLYNVLNAIAMMMNSGLFSDIFRIAALLGVIGIVIASAISGGKTLSLGQMAVCVVMYMCFFQVSTRVNLEDVTTGEFKAVDNVPFGLAAPASLISLIGYSITENMEQAFSTPAMTQYGALDPLFTMASLYDTMTTPMRWRMGSTTDKNLTKSIENYVRDCVISDIARGANTYSNIWRNSSGINSLTSSDFATYAVIEDGKNSNGPFNNPRRASQYRCGDALTKVKDQLSEQATEVDTNMANTLKAIGRCTNCSASEKSLAMMSFYNQNSTSVRDFQLQMMMMPLILNVPVDAQFAAFKGNAAIARAQTQTQQSFQWSSSGSSFLYWMSSFMPIFQGIIYALAPFMAFLIGLGVMGLRMILKYFLIIIWTQTWLPLAAVVNLYILTKLQSSTAAIMIVGLNNATGSTTDISFNQMYDILVATQKHIALAGNLFALIPALGGFIVWGSSVAFNSLANSAAAPAPADTKTLAPDVTNAPALNSRHAEFSSSPMSGTTMTGASGVVGSISMQSIASENLSSANARREMASAQESAARNTMISKLASNQESGSHSSAQNAAISSAIRQNFGSSADQIFNYMEAHGKTATDAISDLNTVSMGASAGLGTGSGPGVSAGVSGGATSASTDQHGNTIQGSKNASNSDAARLASSLGASFEKNLQGALNDVSTKTSQFGMSASDGSTYSNAYTNNQSAEKAYTEAQIFSQSTSSNQSMTFDVLGNKAATTPGLPEKMQQLINSEPGAAQRRDQYANQMQTNGLEGANALAAASVLALKDAGRLNEIAPELGFTSSGSPEITSTAATQNSSVGADAAQVSRNIKNIGGQTKAGASSTESQARGFVDEQKSYTAPKATSARVGERFDNYISSDGPVQHDHNSNKANIEAQQHNSAYNIVADTPTSRSIAREGLSLTNNLVSRLNDNPVIQETRRQAQEVNNAQGNGSQASNAIAEYYALGKAGVVGETLQQARDLALAHVALDTGGTLSSNGQVIGGNREWGERALSMIDNTFEDQGRNDTNTLSTVTLGLHAASGRTLPSNTNSHTQGDSLTGARSNSQSSEQESGTGGSPGVNSEIRIEITEGVNGPNPNKRKI